MTAQEVILLAMNQFDASQPAVGSPSDAAFVRAALARRRAYLAALVPVLEEAGAKLDAAKAAAWLAEADAADRTITIH